MLTIKELLTNTQLFRHNAVILSGKTAQISPEDMCEIIINDIKEMEVRELKDLICFLYRDVTACPDENGGEMITLELKSNKNSFDEVF